ncbi:sulfite exporter TauE/SafE family protein [Rhodovibrionaceae bacterium A322]
MEDGFIFLHLAVLVASLLQAASGIGFGVLAGPVLLMSLNSSSAVQVTILLSFAIALVLLPGLRHDIDRPLLKRLIIGTLPGLALGIWVFSQVSLSSLMLLAGLAVLFLALVSSGLTARLRPLVFAPALNGTATPLKEGVESEALQSGKQTRGDLLIGLISGAMSSSLAMPGPVVAAHLSAQRRPKEVIRATILALFVFSYSAAMAVQVIWAGFENSTANLSLTLLPATLLGVWLGRLLAQRISQKAFQRLIFLLLLLTAFSLLSKATGVLFHA